MIKRDIGLVTYFKNRETQLKAYFKSLLTQVNINYEVIAIDYCSTDGSLNYIKQFKDRYPHLKLLKVIGGNYGFNLSKARNIGCRNVNAKLCMTVDCDVLFSTKDTLRKLVDLFYQFNDFICNFTSLASPYKYDLRDRGVFCYCGGGNMIFHKSLYKRSGGFPNWIKNHGFEDYIFRLRTEHVGGKILKFPGQRIHNLVETYGPAERDFHTREVIDHNREGYIPCESIWEDPKQNTKELVKRLLREDISKIYEPDSEKLPAFCRI